MDASRTLQTITLRVRVLLLVLQAKAVVSANQTKLNKTENVTQLCKNAKLKTIRIWDHVLHAKLALLLLIICVIRQ